MRDLVLIHVAAAACFSAAASLADVEEAWLQRYNGPANHNDYGEDIAVDAAGNVYVAGFHFYPEQQNRYIPEWVLIRYLPDGTRDWVRTYRGNSYASAHRVAIDGAGAVLVAGTDDFHSDWAVRKYDAAGNLQWTGTYDANSIPLTEPEDLVIDGAGNSLMTGYVDTDAGPGHAPIVKFSAAGIQQWRVRYVGPQFEGAAGWGLETDSAGNVYWAGASVIPNRASEFSIAKLSPDGEVLWEDTAGYPGFSTHDRAVDIELDGEGNIVTVGYFGSNSADGLDLVVRKYSSDGTLLWSRTYGQQQRDEAATSLSVDREGNILVAGYAENDSGNLDALIVQYAPNGTLQWEYLVAGTGDDYDWFFDIETDGDGNAYATGSYRPFTGIDHLITVGVDGDGQELWKREYIGPTDGGSRASSIVVAGNDVFVTGESPGNGTGFDIVTIAYSQESSGTAADLVDLVIVDGVLISGGLEQLIASDDSHVVAEARVTGEVAQPHLLRAHLAATSEVEGASQIDLAIESRITDIEASVWVLLYDWESQSFVQVGTYSVGMTERVEQIRVPDAGRFVRTSDGRIELEIKEIVFLPFTLGGFHTYFDQIAIVVQ